MRRSRYQRSVCMKYRFQRVDVFEPSIGVKPSNRSTLPTGQKPVKATLMETNPVAMTPKIHSRSTNNAIAVLANRTTPAINQTVRSIYQRWVGTIYTPERSVILRISFRRSQIYHGRCAGSTVASKHAAFQSAHSINKRRVV